jgi:hypothetical protein
LPHSKLQQQRNSSARKHTDVEGAEKPLFLCNLSITDEGDEKMNIQTIIELIGYIGSALVLISFLMPSVIKLRLINSAGALISAIYALIIHSYPVALMNICLLCINCVQLARLRRTDRTYELVEGQVGDSMMTYMLNHYQADIACCFPGLNMAEAKGDAVYFACCDGTPASLLFGRKQEDGTMEISLDYSTPTYRDCSAGTFLYSQLPAQGIHRLVFPGNPGKHEDYLQKMGFVKEKDVYVKTLA